MNARVSSLSQDVCWFIFTPFALLTLVHWYLRTLFFPLSFPTNTDALSLSLDRLDLRSQMDLS